MNNRLPKILFVLTLFFSFCSLQAQIERPNGISTKVLFIDNYTLDENRNLADFKLSNGIEFGYTRQLSKFLVLGVPFKAGLYNSPTDDNNKTFFGVDGVLKARYFKKSQLFNPYIMAGLGGRYINSDGLDFQIPAGVGVDIKIGPWGYISIQGEYRKSIQLETDNIEYGVGYTAYLGKKKAEEKPVEIEFTIEDRDEDGIVDSLDLCPDMAGIDSLQGCLDTDGDGIFDHEDLCVEVKGIEALKGCPATDTDGDGMLDFEDECPDLYGILKGCPDTDKDGVSDKDDKCPNTKGFNAFGCPGGNDSDGDGLVDSEDRCPYLKGPSLYLGCPDTDNDGINDGEDRCPSVAGSARNLGCPEVVLSNEERNILELAVSNVTFETGNNELTFESFDLLNKVANIIKRHPEYILNIDGHTDNVGDSDKNMKLSTERAKNCYLYLVSEGVNPINMRYQGFGETQPIHDNGSSYGRERNRRVEFNISYIPK